MPITDSDRMKAIIEIGKLEHDEYKVIYQLIIGASLSVSLALVLSFFQRQIDIGGLTFLLLTVFEIAASAYIFLKNKMGAIRENITLQIGGLGNV